MNKERFLFVLSLVGILTLLIIMNFQGYKPLEIKNKNNLNESEAGLIITSGNISKIDIKKEITYLTIKESQLQFVIFTDKNLNLSLNQQIIIYGKLEQYKNKTQIIINKIEKT